MEEAEMILIGPSFEGVHDYQHTESISYPIGLAYLHAALEAKGIATKTLWLNYHPFDDCSKVVMEAIRQKTTRAVGFQMLTANRVACYRLIEKIHKERPEVHIILGGVHATVMYHQLLKRYPFIIIVLGEAEETLPELIRVLDSGGQYPAGIAYSDNGEVVLTEPRGLLEDLDSLPFPRHELFMSPERTMMCVLTSRGCPFHCSFCSLGPISHRKVRYRSVTKVVDEIEEVVSLFPQIKQVWLHDDSFFLDNERVIRFCDELIDRGIRPDFVCSGRIKPVSQEMAQKLEEANFTKVLLGLESGDESVLRRCHKAITQKDTIEVFEKFQHSKINLIAFLIVGLPGETEKTLMETARFVRSLQRIKYAYFHDIGILSVYPGTEVYELEKASGMIDDSYWLSDGPVPFYTLEHTEDELRAYKETLLDYISVDRILTPKAFFKQTALLPSIIRHMASNPETFSLYGKSIAGNVIRLTNSDGGMK